MLKLEQVQTGKQSINNLLLQKNLHFFWHTNNIQSYTKLMKIIIVRLIIALTYIILVIDSKVSSQTRYEYKTYKMGTEINLIFYEYDKDKATAIVDVVLKRINELERELSNYIVNSEVNKLCNQFNVDVKVSDDLYDILSLANTISTQTEGAFDITSAPYIDLWKKAIKTKKIPTNEELLALNKRVGYQNIEFPSLKNTIRLKRKKMQIDLGGIGKGFTADQVLKTLEIYGVKSALIDVGGDLSVSSPPPKKEYWEVSFSYFDKNKNEVVKKIKLKNQSVATSGDLFQYVEIDGSRYSHIVDPTNNGMALKNSYQVTVIASNGAYADGYATALSVLGIDKAKLFSKSLVDIEIFMVQQSANEYVQWNNPEFITYYID